MVPVGSELVWTHHVSTKVANNRWRDDADPKWPYSDGSDSMNPNNVITRLGPAPTATPEPDRSGWPVLVRSTFYDKQPCFRHPERCGTVVWGSGDEWYSCTNSDVGARFGSALAAADAIQARLPEDVASVTAPDPRDTEIADLRSQVEAFRRAACVATGWGEDTTPGDSTLLSDLRAMDIKALRERAESAEATLDAYRIQRDQAREDAAGVRRLLNDAAALRAAAAEACDCDDGEVPADAELARRLRELAREPQDLALVRRVVGIQTAALRKLISEEPTFRDIAIALAADTIDVAVGVQSDRVTCEVATEVKL